MNVIITGDKGEAGSIIKDSLISNNNKCVSYSKNNLHLVDAFVHTAAKHPYDSVNNIFNSNIIFHKQVVDSCKKMNARMFFLSSVSIYGDGVNCKINEDCCINPRSFYGMSKFYGEQYIKAQGVRGYSLRMPAILSLRSNVNVMGRIVNKLVNNMNIVLTNADLPFNAYIDPEDISKFVEFTKEEKRLFCFNFAVDPHLTLYETICILRELTLSKSKIIKSKENSKHTLYSTEKLKKITGFEFSHPIETLERWVSRMQANVIDN